jgi:hypothetical protein
MMPVAATYEPRDPSRTVLYKVIAGSGFGYERVALLPSAHAVAEEGERPELKGPRCGSVNGFSFATASAIGPKGLSLHANTAIPAHRRDQ